MRLAKFVHSGIGSLPDEYLEVYICDALGITYTELREQPVVWVERMLKWLEMKQKKQAKK